MVTVPIYLEASLLEVMPNLMLVQLVWLVLLGGGGLGSKRGCQQGYRSLVSPNPPEESH
jgi:hypothetical protein